MPRQLSERALRIGDDDDRQRKGPAVVAIDHRRASAARRSGSEELVTVEALAAQRDEKFAARDRAAIARDAGKAHVRAARASRKCACRLGDAHHQPVLRASAARATAWSENGSRLPPIS